MERTEEMLVDLMGDVDVELLADSFMEEDLERKRTAWLTTFLKEKNWRRDAAEPVAGSSCGNEEMKAMQNIQDTKGKKRFRRKKAERSPLSYEWGEAIRTDMGIRFRRGMCSVKRRAAAVWGFVYGALTMAVVAVGFFAIIGKKRRAV